MLQADAEIMLIDEVLAVGDASFQQKCADVFHDMRGIGKTVILVTHDMMSVQSYCDRAILLHDGEQIETGDPEDVGRSYIRLNFGGSGGSTAADLGRVGRARPTSMRGSSTRPCSMPPATKPPTSRRASGSASAPGSKRGGPFPSRCSRSTAATRRERRSSASIGSSSQTRRGVTSSRRARSWRSRGRSTTR